jgi:hypothetical protein
MASWGYEPPEGGESVPEGFHYTSDNNDQWFTLGEITKILETDL